MNIIDMPDEPWWPRRQKTALEKLQEDVQRHLDPFHQWEKMQDLLRRSSSDYHLKELLKQSTPGWQLKEILERSTLPKHVQDLLDTSSAVTQAQRMLEQYLPKHKIGFDEDMLFKAKGMSAITEAVNAERHVKPVTEQQEWFKKIQNQALGGRSMLELSRQLEYANPALTALEAARTSLDNLTRTFRNIDFDKFELDGGEEREAKQVAQTIAQAATTEPTLQAAVEQIIAAIEAQQNPTVQVVLWLFFRKMMDWIIAGIIGAVISQHMPQTAPQSPQEATKRVKEVARATFDSPSLLNEYRFVSAKVVHVRQNPKTRSPTLGELSFGKSVKLLKKDKDFALVLWTDNESGTEIQGWVFARYLEKFN